MKARKSDRLAIAESRQYADENAEIKAKVRALLKKGLTPSEVVERTGASYSLVLEMAEWYSQ